MISTLHHYRTKVNLCGKTLFFHSGVRIQYEAQRGYYGHVRLLQMEHLHNSVKSRSHFLLGCSSPVHLYSVAKIRK